MTAQLAFTPATKKQSRLRLALIGPSGSGKTFTACRIAKGLGGRVAVIDTERGSASKYADLFEFSTLELDRYDPDTFIQAIETADRAGFEVLVIDSLSHAWNGKGGILEQVDSIAARSQSKNSFSAWREAGPKQNRLVDAILKSRCHVIVTMRVTTEWVVEKDERTGKNAPRKVGLKPVQKEGMEYEFDVVGDLSDSQLVVSKSRCPALTRAVINEPGEELGRTLAAWLSDGKPAPLSIAPERQDVLPASQPDAKPASGVKAAVRTLRAKQDVSPRVVDVASDETEEEAIAKAKGPIIQTKAGPKSVASFTTDGLLEVANGAESYLGEHPEGKHAPAMRETLRVVSIEIDRRAIEEG